MSLYYSKIEELIKKNCPDGVVFKELWEVTNWDKRFNSVDNYKQSKIIKYHYFLANEFKELIQEYWDVKILTTNSSNLWTTKELSWDLISEGEVVYIPWWGNPNIQYFNGKFITSDNRIATSKDINILNNKFLYYYMLSKKKLIESFYRGAGIRHPNMSQVLGLQIPIPPLPVQKEIVRILDTFTELEEELEEELGARKNQYEYYRDELLSLKNDESKVFLLNEIINFKNGIGHEKNIDENGKYIVVNSKFVSTEGNVRKHSAEQLCPVSKDDILMVMSDLPNGKALAKCFYVESNDKYTLNQRICGLTIKNGKQVNPRFLFYMLNRNPQLLKYDNKVDQTNLRKDDILNIKISIPIKDWQPDLEKQQSIVSILDKFDALVNDISIGLPAELKARRQQYEWYRAKLLMFRPLEQ